MVLRVTNQMQQNNALQNIFRISEDLFRANERIATGKRINRPSDDPSGIRLASSLTVSISQAEQFSRNIDHNRIFVDQGDAALDAVGLDLIRAQELAVGSLSSTASAEIRATTAVEVRALINNLFLSANTRVNNQYIFSGTNSLVEPFQRDPGGLAVYTGNSETFDIEIDRNQTVSITRPGSEVFGVELNPAINVNDTLASLNGGAGIPAGSFTITDREGMSAVIVVAAGDTVNDVLTAINGAAISVTASLNSNQDGLLLTDTSTIISQPLTVTELAGGTTAVSLGILGQRDGDLEGRNLNPTLTASTLIADLDGGNGLTLGQIDILNGGVIDTVDLSGLVTVGAVLAAITGAPTANVTASINSEGNGLRVISNDPTTVAVVQNVGTGDTASLLGIGGGENIFVALETLELALLADDTGAINGLLDALSSSVDHISNQRAAFGATAQRMDKADTIHDDAVVDLTDQRSAVEDSDIIQDASDIAGLELAFEATLDVSARILQTSILNFLR